MKTTTTLALFVLYSGIAVSAMAEDAAVQSNTSTAPADSNTTYIGKIAGKYAFEMDLSKSGKELTGNYKYIGQAKALSLKGAVDDHGGFTMSEVDEKAKITGIFTGKITGVSIVGEWRTPDGAKKMNFEAHQTAAPRKAGSQIKTKREALQNAVGSYYLSAISGAAGANTMFDTEKTNSGWRSSSSSISGGMREGQQDALSKDDIKLLNSMHIQVDAALATRFYAGGSLLLEVPFMEDGMLHNLSKPRSSVLDSEMKRYSPTTTFIDERVMNGDVPPTTSINRKLYLAAIDGVDYSKTIAGGFEVITGDIVVLSYSPVSDIFEMQISVASCCSSNVLTFIRK